MCAVSVMLTYGLSLPREFWDEATITSFHRVIDEAKRFDEETGQPDCEDSRKTELLDQIDALLARSGGTA